MVGIMKNYLLLTYSLLASLSLANLNATTYFPTPLEDQLRESYGVVRGNFKKKVYKRKSNGQVFTEISIELKETTGLLPGDIINKNNFKISFPGGSWQGIKYSISGAPKFKKNEDIILLINKGPNGFHLLNFGLGKYTVVKEDGVLLLKSSVFPNNSKVSDIKLSVFKEMTRDKLGHPLRKFKGEKFVYQANDIGSRRNSRGERTSRAPASIFIEEVDDDPRNTTMFWLMLILAILGTSSYKLLNRRS